MCLIRADGSVVLENCKDDEETEDVVVSMSETANGAIEAEAPEVVEKDEASTVQAPQPPVLREAPKEPADMVQVVGVLTNLAWATAMGNIAAMGSSIPMAAPVKRAEDPSEKTTVNRTTSSLSEEEDESGQDHDDMYLCHQAFNLLGWCLSKHKNLLKTLISSPCIAQFIVDTVLHCPYSYLRYQAADMFLKLSMEEGARGESEVHKCILMALLGAKAEADKQPYQCCPYWELICRILSSMRDPEGRETAKQQVVEEVRWLKQAPAANDDKDKRLEGHLMLVRTLVEILSFQAIGSSKGPQGEGLIQLLIKQFLFPESVLLLGEDPAAGENETVPRPQFGVLKDSTLEDAFLQAKCGTRSSRLHAFQLLAVLASQHFDNAKEVMSLLLRLHFKEDWIKDWEYLPSYGRKALGGYVGLKNAGATCYMNSVFQQLYMQPQVRRTVLAANHTDDRDRSDSVFYQVQAMFGALLGSSLDHFVPQGFWNTYRDYDGLPINLREHQDAFEFFNRLYDTIDETLKAGHHEPTLTRIFGGCFAQQVICRGCPHRSEREEPFAAISVDVKNKRDLLESLDSFVSGDLLEADNAYYCEICGKKVDALKRVCVKTLPHTLVIHLKRFDFDYETMQRLKLKDRFEFPFHLDMKPFTVEGLAMREREAALTSKERSRSQDLTADRWHANGTSSAADVAMDSADDDEARRLEEQEDSSSKRQMVDRSAGRPRPSPSRLESLEVDSSEVREARMRGSPKVEEAERASTGAESGQIGGHAVQNIQFREDSYYQYDLVGVVVHSGTAFAGHYYSYIKERSGDRIHAGEEPSGGRWVSFDDKRVEPYDVNDLEKDCFGGKYTVEVFDNFLKTSTPQDFDRPNSAYMLLYERCEQSAKDVSSSGDTVSATNVPNCKDGQESAERMQAAPSTSGRELVHLPPSIHRSVWEENLRFVHENHLLDKDYFRFLRTLVENNLTAMALNNKQRLDSRNSGETAALIAKLIDQIAVQTMDLATEFLCRVWLRTHNSLRDDMPVWRTVVNKILEFSPSACRSFQMKMVQRRPLLLNFLLKCPVEDIRMMFASMLVCSLQHSSRFLNGKPLAMNTQTGRNEDLLGVDQLIQSLVSLLQEGANSTAFYPQQYFQVFGEYAAVGAPQRYSLLTKRVIPLWVEFVCQFTASVAYKLDLTGLNSVIALLVCSCDVSKYCDATERVVVEESEEGGAKTTPSFAPNPYQSAAPNVAISIPRESYEVLTKSNYLRILVEHFCDQDDVCTLLEFLSWQSTTNSTSILVDTMASVRRTTVPDVRSTLTLLLRLVVLEDSLMRERQHVVLLGSDIFRPPMGILEYMVQKQLNLQKRYALVKFVIKLTRMSAFAREVIASKRGEWKRIVEWLQSEVEALGSPGGLNAPSPSNQEVASPHYLQRTGSLESTLTAARNLLTSISQP